MLKKMLSDRRGVAIELAILMTAVCMAVTTIVLSTALLQYEHKVRAERQMEENVIFEQIVETWLNDKQGKVTFTQPGYCGEVVKNGNQEVIGFEIFKTDENGNRTGNAVLTISVGADGKITSWTKG